MTFRPYEAVDRDVLVAMFEEYQDGFVVMDPLARTRRQPGYGEAALAELEQLVGRRGRAVRAGRGRGWHPGLRGRHRQPHHADAGAAWAGRDVGPCATSCTCARTPAAAGWAAS